MLGYVISEGRGAANRLIADSARALLAQGWRLAGAWQVDEPQPDRAPHMILHPMAGAPLRISQDLGPLARGCRLDPAALEAAAALAEAQLAADPPPDLLIVNKFGKQEAQGGGFRAAIGQALSAGVPVLTAVSLRDRAPFDAFADGLGEALPFELAAVLDWVAARRDAARAEP